MPKSEYARSQYEEDSDVDLSDYYEEGGDDDDGGGAGARRSSTAGSGDTATYISQVEKAMDQVKSLNEATDWKRMIKHRSGVQVFVKKGKIPIFKGEGVIKGYSPASVFAVVGTRKLWDEWYEEGNLVENLNDTSSLTYMCMKGIVGSSTRDLSLAEKVEGTSSGAILFCSTSVDSPRVPKVSGRTRAQIKLNGWVLEPIKLVDGGNKPATKITYFLQVDVKTFVPSAFSSRYLARRPLCITKIDGYLQKNGAPPMAGVDQAETEAGQGGGKGGRGMSTTQVDGAAAGAAITAGAAAGGRSRRGSVSSKRSARSVRSTGGESAKTLSGFAMPPHVSADESAKSFGEVQKAKELFRKLIKDSESGKWNAAQDRTGAKIMMKGGGDKLPTVKGESSVGGVSTEQVVMTILSTAAAKTWDDRLGERKLLDGHNGHDQGIYLETQKGIYPHLPPRHFVVARGVERDDHLNDHGAITAVARSLEHKHDEDVSKYGDRATLQVSGWSVEPVDDEVQIVHISQQDLNLDEPLKPFLLRVLASGLASGPRKIRDFIDEFGHAPGFVRWGQGPAELLGDDGDLEKGEAEWTIGDGGDKAKGGEQIAWFQWSEKMYPKGIALQMEPASAATVAKVDQISRTLQFTWGKVPKSNVRLTVKKSDESGATLNGKKIRDSVAPPAAAAGAAGMKKRGKPKKSAANGADSKKDADKKDEKDKKAQPNGDAKAAAGAGAAGGALGAVGGLFSKAAGPAAPGRASTREDGKIPRDALIIINNDLYITRTQFFAFVAFGLLAYYIGKLTA